VAVQEIRWIEGGSQPEDDFTFVCGNGNANHHLGASLFVHKEILSAVKRYNLLVKVVVYYTNRSFVWYYRSECSCTN